MPSLRVSTELNTGTYFLTLTVERWYYLFDQFNRWQILADSLRYCQSHKSQQLHGYLFILNHLHIIITSPDVAGFIRDFRRFTSKRIKENLLAHELRVLALFLDDEGKCRFWQNINAPKKIENPNFHL